MKAREVLQAIVGCVLIFSLACVVAIAVVGPVYLWERW